MECRVVGTWVGEVLRVTEAGVTGFPRLGTVEGGP